MTCLIATMVLAPGVLPAATQSQSMPVVPKWERFEHEFTSLADYANPLQDVTVTVLFVSPLGETTQVYGFWDGGRTWRVRFAPDQPGHWRFKSTCSDAANLGLNEQTGEFLCTSTLSQSRFFLHGPVRVAADRQHLEHEDGTPFFWLGDGVWSGARSSDPKSWQVYGIVRSSQNFTVAEWAATGGEDDKGQSAFTGFPEKIGINPQFFRGLDSKIATLSEVGLLSAIAPFDPAAPASAPMALPDDQAALVMRYMVARWGGDPVAWILPVGKSTNELHRWSRIGREVFAGTHHAPVLVWAKDEPEVLSSFRDQDWVDMLGFQAPLPSDNERLRSVLTGEALDTSSPNRLLPLIGFTPVENAPSGGSGRRPNASDVRTSAYWSLLLGHAAGVSYGAFGVENWDTTVGPKSEDKLGAGLAFWHKALFMPGAKQVGHMAGLLGELKFWQLRPEPKMVANTAATARAAGRIFAASTQAKDLALVYVSDERMLELAEDAMPQAPAITWYNPRQGDTSPAVAVVAQRTCQFPTPAPGDWLLVIKAGK